MIVFSINFHIGSLARIQFAKWLYGIFIPFVRQALAGVDILGKGMMGEGLPSNGSDLSINPLFTFL